MVSVLLYLYKSIRENCNQIRTEKRTWAINNFECKGETKTPVDFFSANKNA